MDDALVCCKTVKEGLFKRKICKFARMFQNFDTAVPGGGGDLRMDGGLPPGFQKATLF